MLNIFIEAIKEKKLIEVTFIAKKDNVNRTRKCVPFDYACGKRDKNQIQKYQLYDLDSPNGRHNLALEENQIINLVKLDEIFNPADYISWETNWEIARDWDEYS
ncbi:hypothetical protein [Sulfurimonas sp.]|uniref:hypothetical protein n=1 Tax=Sulfurimonas sp. TaxID=2022749 RepID=UPI002AB2ADCD|nr:hypothetical protein [Sulfurimonas sp.]